MTRVPWHRLETWLFPMTVFAFMAPSVQYVNQVFNQNLRWVFLALLTIDLLVRGRASSVFRGNLGLPLLLLMGWPFATILWSIVPQLSLAKSIAYVFVVVAMIGAGQYWALRHSLSRSLDYLLPLALLAIFASVLGPSLRAGGGIVTTGSGVNLYTGLVGNPNMLGSLMAMSVPVLLWRLYQDRITQWRNLWILLFGTLVVSLLLANSRSALLGALFTCLGMIVNLSRQRRQMVISAIISLALVVVVAAPALIDTAADRYIYKATNNDNGVVYSREEVWKISWEHALEGGLAGVGYGATVGETSFAGGLTAVGYGREKGNTQMAIMEETGLVGLGSYLIFLTVLFGRMVHSFRWVYTHDERVLLGILTGMLVGLTVQGIFEAWWVAPGSPESGYWWAFVGVASGFSLSLERRAREVQRMARTRKITAALPE